MQWPVEAANVHGHGGLPFHPTDTEGGVTKTKKHSELIIEHFSTAVTKTLFNPSFWAWVTGMKEMQAVGALVKDDHTQPL